MRVVRDLSITEKALVFRRTWLSRSREARRPFQTDEDYYWEMEQNHPNFMEFPDDGPKSEPLPGQTSNPNEVDMSDVEKL